MASEPTLETLNPPVVPVSADVENFVYREFTNQWNGEAYMDWSPTREAYKAWHAKISEIEEHPDFGCETAEGTCLSKYWEYLVYMSEQ